MLRASRWRRCGLTGLLAVLALCLAPAAAESKLISFGSFPATSPSGVAVDQSSGDVYVTPIHSSINKFDASGKKLISPPSPFGAAEEPAWYSGAAVNPTNGDLYAVDAFFKSEGFGAIDTYDPNTGALIGEPFPVPESGNFFFNFTTFAQIGADSAGNVYVPVAPTSVVRKYSPSGTLLQTFTGSEEHALSGPTGVTVDQVSGDVWVADTGDNRIEEFDPTGAFLAEIKSEGVQSVALDASGDVFALVHRAGFCGSLAPPCFHVVEYSSAGAQLADVGAGTIGPSFFGSAPGELAVNEASGHVYVPDFEHEKVWIFGQPFAPVLEKELTAEVTSSEAKLGALINPGGEETTYRFEYGTTSSYGNTTPFPEGDVGSGVTPRTVWASATGLEPGTTYHYRVIARSALGKVEGQDQTFTTPPAAQASCPNEQFRRIGFSASLPDCRAYELVTPPTKASTQPDGTSEPFGENHASRGGSRFSFFSIDSLPGSETDGESYLSTRSESGWASEDLIPLQPYTSLECPIHGTGMPAYAPDLSRSVMFAGAFQSGSSGSSEGGCGAEESPQLVSGEPQGVQNLFLRDNTKPKGAYQLIDVTPPGVTPADANFDGASSDLSHVVFDEHAQLTADAPAGLDDLYEWSGGVVRLVTVLPDGTPVVGSLAVAGGSLTNGQAAEQVVSIDGSRVLFTANGNLYARLHGTSTVQVDASQAGGGGGGGHFMDASADVSQAFDGSHVFFTDDASAALTSDTVPGSGQNLYRYDLSTGKLTDLTPHAAAEVQGVIGVSKDGSHVYFVASGVLASNENANKETATTGQDNLYVSQNGATTFIATVAHEFDTCVTRGCARVSSNGAFLAFQSQKSLTGYDNTDARTGTPDPEIFLYSSGEDHLVCASCNPSGEAPVGGALMELHSAPAPHYLADSGRLFFDTPDALLPSDTNRQTDVYEYEGGQLQLISTGTSSTESLILDASAEGSDVFFLTRQKLVPQDTEEEARNIYDARVAGGFPAPLSSPSCATAESCRSAPAPEPSLFGAPASSTASDPGNLAPPVSQPKPKPKPPKCKKGFVKKKVKKKVRCVRKRTRKASKSARTKTRGK